MTLSSADLRWDELISIMGKLKGGKLTAERIRSIDYFERCSYLKFNLVLLAPQFQYRIENCEDFFHAIVLNGPQGRVKYYAIRVEFQVRGSPHIHSFLWILNALVVIYGVFWDNWDQTKLNFTNLIKDLIPLKTLTYKKH